VAIECITSTQVNSHTLEISTFSMLVILHMVLEHRENDILYMRISLFNIF